MSCDYTDSFNEEGAKYMKRIINGIKLSAFFALAMNAAEANKTLVYCSEASPEGFNPALFTTGTTFDAASKTLFNRLVEFKLGTTEVEPGLAERWEVSKDGKTYTFYLRKNVQFNSTKDFKSTRNFNADDVIFSFERQLDVNNPYHKISGGNYEYFNSMGMGSLIKKIDRVNDYTVRFELNHAEAPFIANLAMDFASIFSAEQAQEYLKNGTPEKLDQTPVGTGPFQLFQYRKDATIRYMANKHYWGGVPKISRLIFAITPDASVRYAKIQSGECQVMPFPNPSDIALMEKNKSIHVMQKEGLNVGYLAFNVQKKPFDNIKVRQALNMAIDKAAIIKAVFDNKATIAKNPIPPTMWSYNDEVKDYPYDIEKAKALLAEAGYENGFTTTIWAMPVQRPYNPDARKMAEIIQADWEKIGVKAKIVSYEWGEYLNRAQKGEHDTILLGWTGDNGDPDNFLSVLLSCDAVKGANYAKWCNKEFDALIAKAKRLSDQGERTKLYKKAQVVFKEQAPWVTIAHARTYVPVSNKVHGYIVDPLGTHQFKSVSVN